MEPRTLLSPPTVTGIAPTSGPAAGGTPVAITGTGFTGATAVDFGTTAATDVAVVNDTSITADSPAGTGTVDVTVTTPGGSSAISQPADQFTYTAVPTVIGLGPTSGPAAGGTLVTILGTGFTGATAVDFGTTASTGVTVVNATDITAISPAGTGTVNVTVTAPGGTSVTSSSSQFNYIAAVAPTVTALSPISGPPAGGTSVTIFGTGFTGATAVDFGTTAATDLTVESASTITADSPAGTGVVDVTVITPAGTSATSPADQFTYAVAPTVTGLSPTTGPAEGGAVVTITGTGFTGATAVDFGTTATTSFTVDSDTTITAGSPAGTGTVDVTVIIPGATSAITAADQFTYAVAPPQVVSLSRLGFDAQPTSLALTFSSALDPTPAEEVHNYRIVTIGGRGKNGALVGHVTRVRAAVYDQATLTVTLYPAQRLDIHNLYRVTVNGTTPSGLTSATGVPLDGQGNGTPGTNYSAVISPKTLAGPAPATQVAARKTLAAHRRLIKGPSASAVDALSASGKLTARPKGVGIQNEQTPLIVQKDRPGNQGRG
ncbi:MAG: IPT/TIG domain-containing protein [Isosphaerales bacterium]